MALLRALDLRPPTTAKAAGARSGGKVKVGAQMEIGTRQFTPFKTKYGDLQITATVKATGAFVLASGGDLDVGINVASKDKKDSRATGTKKSIGWKGFDERTLLDGFDLKDLSLAAEFEISGTDVTVACAFSFFVVTHSFAAPAQAKLVILWIKGGDQVKGPGIEIKVASAPFRLKIGGVDASVVAEVKASFLVDIKKVGAEIGKKIVVWAGVKMLEREAAKQGLQVLSGLVARAVLKDLGPLAAAFGVGWDIGEVLNAYTVAPQVSAAAIERARAGPAGDAKPTRRSPRRRDATGASRPVARRALSRTGARPQNRSGQRHHQQLGCTRNQDPLRAEHGDRTDGGQ